MVGIGRFQHPGGPLGKLVLGDLAVAVAIHPLEHRLAIDSAGLTWALPPLFLGSIGPLAALRTLRECGDKLFLRQFAVAIAIAFAEHTAQQPTVFVWHFIPSDEAVLVRVQPIK